MEDAVNDARSDAELRKDARRIENDPVNRFQARARKNFSKNFPFVVGTCVPTLTGLPNVNVNGAAVHFPVFIAFEIR